MTSPSRGPEALVLSTGASTAVSMAIRFSGSCMSKHSTFVVRQRFPFPVADSRKALAAAGLRLPLRIVGRARYLGRVISFDGCSALQGAQNFVPARDNLVPSLQPAQHLDVGRSRNAGSDRHKDHAQPLVFFAQHVNALHN